MTLQSSNLISRCYYCSTPGGPGVPAAIAVGLVIAIALAAAISWGVYRQRRRSRANEASLERQKRWYDAELRRENIAAAAAADEQARGQALGPDEIHRDTRAGTGTRSAREQEPPPSYEGPAVPLRNLNADLGRRTEGWDSNIAS
jgi:hypothetical protein